MVAWLFFLGRTRAACSRTITLIGRVRLAARAQLFSTPLTTALGGVNKAYHGAKLGKDDSWPRVYGGPTLIVQISVLFRVQLIESGIPNGFPSLTLCTCSYLTMEAGDTVFFHPLLIHGRCQAAPACSCICLHFLCAASLSVLLVPNPPQQRRKHNEGLSQSHFLSLRFL